MPKRANGEGSIFKEANGRYRVAVTITVGGKRKRITATAWKHSVAVAKLHELRNRSTGRQRFSDVVTVGQLIQRWLDVCCRSGTGQTKIALSTLRNRESIFRNRIEKQIGNRKFESFSMADAEDFLSSLESSGTRTASMLWVRQICRLAFEYAKKHGNITANPFDGLTIARDQTKAIDPFSVDQVWRILKAVEGTRNFALLQMAFTTGMRQGELFGLRRDRVNIPEKYLIVDSQAVEVYGKIHITKPKTPTSTRKISLTETCVKAIQKHIAILKRDGIDSSEYLFPNASGGIQSRSNWWAGTWKPLLKRLGIAHRGANAIRHTFATHAIANGIPGPVVAQILGHSRTSVTLDTYSQAMPTHQAESVKKIEEIYR